MTLSRPLPQASKFVAAGARRFSINDSLAWLVVAIAALSPVPLGSNGSVAWTLSAAIIAAVGAAYGISLVAVRDTLRVPLKSIGPESLLWAALIGFTLFQVLPASWWGGNPHLIDVEGNIYPLLQISAAPGTTWLSTISLAGYGIFFLLCLQVTANRQRALLLAKAVFAVLVAHAVWGLMALAFWGDTLLAFDKWAYQGVATGTFVNRNSYATFLAVGFVLGSGLTLRAALRRNSEKGQRLPRQDEKLARVGLLGVGTILILAALLATQSRMGMSAAGVGALLLLVIAILKQGYGRRRVAVAAGVATIALGAITMVVFGAGTLERLGSVESDGDVRLQLYAQVMDLISQHWLTGTGAGSFEVVYPLYHRWPVSPDMIWDKAHNTYLTLWSEMGLIMGSIPALVLALLATRLVFIVSKRKDDWWLSAIALSVLAVVGVHSLVDFSMEIQGVVYMVILVLSLGLDFRRATKTASQSGQAS